MKYLVVTGGVVSGLGKGISISSMGVLLKAAGLRVTAIKIDPYLVRPLSISSPARIVRCAAWVWRRKLLVCVLKCFSDGALTPRVVVNVVHLALTSTVQLRASFVDLAVGLPARNALSRGHFPTVIICVAYTMHALLMRHCVSVSFCRTLMPAPCLPLSTVKCLS